MQAAQFRFGLLQNGAPLGTQIAAGAIDVKTEHRHRTAIDGAFFLRALLR